MAAKRPKSLVHNKTLQYKCNCKLEVLITSPVSPLLPIKCRFFVFPNLYFLILKFSMTLTKLLKTF